MQIQVIDVSPLTTTPNSVGGSYGSIEVAFKKDGKVEGKKLVSFKNPDVFKVALEAKPGEVYDVTLVKEGKYWQWTEMVLSNFVESEKDIPQSQGTTASPQKSTDAPARPANRVTGSNYETPQERALRQLLIVRQSSITAALTLGQHNVDKKTLSLKEVLETAALFEAHVFREADKGAAAIIKMKDDIPF